MTWQAGQQASKMHMLRNISKCKENQAMKFGQSIEWNMRKKIFRKGYTKCAGGASSWIEIEIEHISEAIIEVLDSLFYCISKSMTTKI